MKLTENVRRRLLHEGVTDLAAAEQLLDGSMGVIGDSVRGWPQAARYDRVDRGTVLFCERHERSLKRCAGEGLPCRGVPVEGGDPTGEAGTDHDDAAADQREIDKLVSSLSTGARRLHVLLGKHAPLPADHRPDPASAPPGWCVNCWAKGDKAHRDVATRPDGTAYYKDPAGSTGYLCQWCGRYKAEQGHLPPAEDVLRHVARGSDR